MVLGGVVAVAVGALFLSGCSSGSPTTASTTTSTSTSAAAGGGSTTTGVGSAGSSTTSTTSGAPQNLVATAALKSALTAAFVAHRGLPAAEVAGTAPNSVFYGFVPSTNTYWAIAGFVPSANASNNTQVAMQDEGCCGIFTSGTAGGPWMYVAGYLGSPCGGQILAALEQLWNLTPPGDCSPATTTTS